jgi:hypothetical protein
MLSENDIEEIKIYADQTPLDIANDMGTLFSPEDKSPGLDAAAGHEETSRLFAKCRAKLELIRHAA